jgi:hypothetical protein
MIASEPRVRRRGFFLHSETTGEPEVGELENPEGFIVRVRIGRPASPRHAGGTSRGSRSADPPEPAEDQPQVRSGSVTDSRQRAGLPR